MWTIKKIAVLSDPQLSVGPLLSEEDIAGHQQALNLLRIAEQQARLRLTAAEEEATRLLAEAQQRADEVVALRQQEFIIQTEQLFADWRQQQQEWRQALLPKAETLLRQAMEQLLAEQPTSSRLETMLQQLLRAQGRQTAATLSCAPESLPVVGAWLEQHVQPGWRLIGDGSLDADSLRLATENGELSLSWRQVCLALIPAAQ